MTNAQSNEPSAAQSPEHPRFTLSTYSPGGFGFGFGGAKIIGIEHLPENSRPGDIVFFGLDVEVNRRFGAHNPGAAAFTREKTFCMMPWTQACASPCHDIGIVNTADAGESMQAVRVVSRYLTAAGRRPVLIGCDHTASLAGVMGVADGAGPPLIYLYFDAHYDLGLHNQTPELHNGNFVNALLDTGRFDNIINVGGRCWSHYVPVYHNVPGFLWIPGGVDHAGADAIVEHLSWFRGARLYVSIDADILDPSCAPNVGCPEPFGMSAAGLFSVCEWLGKSCTVMGADLCEIVPSERSMESESALMRCIHALFPRSRAWRPAVSSCQ